MSGSNGTKAPTAAQRAHRQSQDAAKAETNLAQVFGQTVAEVLIQVLPQALAQISTQPACVVCAMVRKQAELAWRAQVEAVVNEYRVAVENAKAAAEELPPVQQSFTWVPVLLRTDMAPQPLPVCYDHMPATAAQAGLPPMRRETGLVFPDGRPIVAQGS